MPEPAHTPTPWKAIRPASAEWQIQAPMQLAPHGGPWPDSKEKILTFFRLPRPSDVHCTIGEDGQVWMTMGYEEWIQFKGPDFMAMQAANAAFIVRACNSHDELVAACKDAATDIHGFLGGAWSGKEGWDALAARLEAAITSTEPIKDVEDNDEPEPISPPEREPDDDEIEAARAKIATARAAIAKAEPPAAASGGQ